MKKLKYLLIINIILCLNIACESPKKEATENSINNSNLEKVRIKFKERLRKSFPQKDSSEYIFYLKKRYNKEELAQIKAKEIEVWQEKLKQEFDTDFKIKQHSKYFNIAYRCTEAQVQHLAYVLEVFFESVYTRFFKYEPENPFHIVYFANKPEYREYTEHNSYGFYMPSNKTFYTYAGSGVGTLWHEITHAFVDANQDKVIQQWFSEGFASFYEMAAIQNQTFIEGYTNWRMPALQQAIREDNFIPLLEFFSESRMTEDYGYAKARFFFCYLWLYDKMDEFVNIYLYQIIPKYKGKEQGKQVIKTVEKLIGKDIKEIEKEYKKLALQYRDFQKLQKFN